jgi:hypothetical protein
MKTLASHISRFPVLLVLLAAAAATTLLQFPMSGIVLAPQTAILVDFNFSNGSTLGFGSFSATLHGYFTSN